MNRRSFLRGGALAIFGAAVAPLLPKFAAPALAPTVTTGWMPATPYKVGDVVAMPPQHFNCRCTVELISMDARGRATLTLEKDVQVNLQPWDVLTLDNEEYMVERIDWRYLGSDGEAEAVSLPSKLSSEVFDEVAPPVYGDAGALRRLADALGRPHEHDAMRLAAGRSGALPV